MKEYCTILYDFDFRYSALAKGGAEFPTLSLPEWVKDKSDLVRYLKEGKEFFDLNFIGGGGDSIAILNSRTKAVFVIDPCNSLMFAIAVDGALQYYLTIQKESKIVYKGVMMLTLGDYLRSDEKRGYEELNVEINLYQKEDGGWDIEFLSLVSNYSFRICLVVFAEAYVDFLLKTKAFFDNLMPDYQQVNLLKSFPLTVEQSAIHKYVDDIPVRNVLEGTSYYDYQ